MKKQGNYYQHTKPGNGAIILCTENSDSSFFSGVCIRPGGDLHLGRHSKMWTSNIFTEIKYNDKSLEEKINEELLESKKKLIIFDEETPEYESIQSQIHLLEKLKQ